MAAGSASQKMPMKGIPAPGNTAGGMSPGGPLGPKPMTPRKYTMNTSGMDPRVRMWLQGAQGGDSMMRLLLQAHAPDAFQAFQQQQSNPRQPINGLGLTQAPIYGANDRRR